MTNDKQQMILFKAVAMLLILPVASTAAIAQQSRNGALDNWENVVGTPSERKIKVRTLDLKEFSGRLVDVTDDSIVIRRKKKERVILREEIVRVRVAQPFHRGKRTLMFTGAGAAAGAVFPLAEAAQDSCLCGGGEEINVNGQGVLIGATIGSILGAMLGLTAPPRYSVVYETWEANHAWRGPER